MTWTLIALLVTAAAMLLWSASRAAAEVAGRHARDACKRAGVQLLDQTVALAGIGLQRDEHGRLRWLRRYSFDYSAQGHDRQRGSVALLGGQLLWVTEPQAGPPA